jgi:hypothetical protein
MKNVCMTENLYYKIGEWSKQAFPDATEIEHLLKLKQETEEVIERPKNEDEYADCFMCLMAAAYKANIPYEQLQLAIAHKLNVNRKRQWVRLEDGTYQHVPSNG